MTDVNLDYSNCIKEVSNIGSTSYHNICDGSSTVINWGTVNWISNISIAIVIGLCVVLVIGLIGLTVFTLRD